LRECVVCGKSQIHAGRYGAVWARLLLVQFSGNIAGKVYFVLAIVAIAIVYFGVPVTCINHYYSYCGPMLALHDNPLPLIVALILTGVVVELLVRAIGGRREKEVGRDLGRMPSMSCANCGKRMRYSFSRSKWVCDKCQTSRDGPPPMRSDADDEGTTWTYHPPPERKPETGVGSEAWEANRAREIRELREEERKKAAEWRKSHADA